MSMSFFLLLISLFINMLFFFLSYLINKYFFIYDILLISIFSDVVLLTIVFICVIMIILYIFVAIFFNCIVMGIVYSGRLDKLVTQSCLLIRRAYRHVKWQGDGSRLELAYSGGKDSDVLVGLCKLSGVWGGEYLRPLHRCTTIDPPFTLQHCVDVGVEIYRRNRFRDCVLASGFPSRFVRHCCGSLFGKDDCRQRLEGYFGVGL